MESRSPAIQLDNKALVLRLNLIGYPLLAATTIAAEIPFREWLKKDGDRYDEAYEDFEEALDCLLEEEEIDEEEFGTAVYDLIHKHNPTDMIRFFSDFDEVRDFFSCLLQDANNGECSLKEINNAYLDYLVKQQIAAGQKTSTEKSKAVYIARSLSVLEEANRNIQEVKTEQKSTSAKVTFALKVKSPTPCSSDHYDECMARLKQKNLSPTPQNVSREVSTLNDNLPQHGSSEQQSSRMAVPVFRK